MYLTIEIEPPWEDKEETYNNFFMNPEILIH